jgi:ferredoxin-NADP reductase
LLCLTLFKSNYFKKGEDNAPDGLVSSYLKNSLKVGDSIEVGMPFGTMTTTKVDYVNKPVVFIVGGIGIGIFNFPFTVSFLNF